MYVGHPVDEATIEDGVPTTAGWFVINARDARWMHNEMRTVCKFGGEGPAHFDELGVGLYWIEPGHPMTLYHHEAGQEDFLVLRGACVLVIEGQERRLGAWDFVHCPPGTAHTIVAAGEGPALILAVGARREKAARAIPWSLPLFATAPACPTPTPRHASTTPASACRDRDPPPSSRRHWAAPSAPRRRAGRRTGRPDESAAA
jgi:uncharacterized cupin superfamily protein